jgi:hypothetical protein
MTPSAGSAFLTAAAVFLLAGSATAQGLPFSVHANGEVSAGFFWADATGPGNSRRDAPLLLSVNAFGFIGHPDLVAYRVRPRLATAFAGGQRGERGIGGDDSLLLDFTFFRKRAFPFSLQYTISWIDSFQFEDEAVRPPGTKLTTFSYNQQLFLPRLPRLSFSYGHSGFSQQDRDTQLTRAPSFSRRIGFAARDQYWGWKWLARYTRSRTTREADLGSGLLPLDSARERTNFDVRIDRKLPWQGRFDFRGGERARSDEFRGTRSSTSFRFADARATMLPRPKLSLSVTTNYTSNVLAQRLQSLLGTEGSADAGSDFLLDTRSTGSGLGLGVGASYRLHRDWTASVGVNQSRSFLPETRADGQDGSSHGLVGNLSFRHAFRRFDAQANFGVTRSTSEIFGTRNTSQGNSLMAGIGTGRLDVLRVGAHVFYSQTDNSNDALFGDPFKNNSNSQGFGVDLSRRLSWFRLNTNITYSTNSSLSLGQENSADAVRLVFTAHHPRFTVNYGISSSDNTRFLPVSGLPSPGGLPFLASLDSTGTQSLSASFRPLSRLSVSSSWVKVDRVLNEVAQGDLQSFQTRAEYSFRQLRLFGGYETFSQSVIDQFFPDASLGRLGRSRLFLRVIRSFNIL